MQIKFRGDILTHFKIPMTLILDNNEVNLGANVVII